MSSSMSSSSSRPWAMSKAGGEEAIPGGLEAAPTEDVASSMAPRDRLRLALAGAPRLAESMFGRRGELLEGSVSRPSKVLVVNRVIVHTSWLRSLHGTIASVSINLQRNRQQPMNGMFVDVFRQEFRAVAYGTERRRGVIKGIQGNCGAVASRFPNFASRRVWFKWR